MLLLSTCTYIRARYAPHQSLVRVHRFFHETPSWITIQRVSDQTRVADGKAFEHRVHPTWALIFLLPRSSLPAPSRRLRCGQAFLPLLAANREISSRDGEWRVFEARKENESHVGWKKNLMKRNTRLRWNWEKKHYIGAKRVREKSAVDSEEEWKLRKSRRIRDQRGVPQESRRKMGKKMQQDRK